MVLLGHVWNRQVDHFSCEDNLRDLGLFSLKKRRHQGDLTVAFQWYLKDTYRKDGDFLSGSVVIHQGSKGFKLKECNCRLNIQNKFFTWRAVRHWHCCTELWVPHPWQCSRPNSMGSWAARPSGWQPCPWQGGWS